MFAKEAVVGTLNSLYNQIDAAAELKAGASEPFDLRAGVLEALASIPRGLASIFTTLADPLGTGVVSGQEQVVAREVAADTAVFAMSLSSWVQTNFIVSVLVFGPTPCLIGVRRNLCAAT